MTTSSAKDSMSPQEQQIIQSIFNNSALADFVISNLCRSLASIGFSFGLIEDLTKDISNIHPEEFGKKHFNELETIYRIGFFQKIVPEYFSEYVVSAIPNSANLLDVGCGTVILAKPDKVIGIDINEYPEWKEFQSEKIRFQIVQEKEFMNFLKITKPATVTLTWTLHHMEYEEQERYIRYLFDSLPPNSQVVILEDAYAEFLSPENGVDKSEAFMKWNLEERKQIMSVYDWVANCVLAQRGKVPIPFAYRTLEKWEELFKNIGFSIASHKYIGFPDRRDINTPQSLFVVAK